MEGLPEDAPLPVEPVEEPAIPKSSEDLQPPTKATEPGEAVEEAAPAAALQDGKAINISQLQAMSMAELNQMAKDMGIETPREDTKKETLFDGTLFDPADPERYAKSFAVHSMA